MTGEEVNVPLGQRMLIAGRSGAGKSWSARPLLYDASEGETNSLAIIDLKQVEARCWDHRARVATTPEAVEQLVAELVEEQTERLAMVPKGEDTITPTKERPRITLFVDEGAEVMTVAKDALAGLESIARMGRAACIDLWWATQKPTMSGSSAGIPPQIAPQLSTRICLAVSSPTEARTVLGEDAQAKGWTADELPAPGYALVRDGKRKPNAVKTRALSPKQVVALPDRPIWERLGVAPVIINMRKPPAPPAPPAEGTDERVLRIVGDGPARQKDIAEQAGLPKGTVSKVVARLVETGQLARLEDGTVAAR
ncbi:MarR family transcriptional regulator [Streptomyces sp. NPDC001982]|uniref:MarR family transcriptional regulator n=1 Tax=unclassified Streptomyces TaxID=2593676 RepID=UPI00332E024C